jgi:pimeloyl-ACP methyl ester carboxylesterase
VEELIEAGKQFSKEALQQYYKAMMERPDRTHVLQGSKLPVLFIMGTEDVAAPLNDMLQQSKLPNCSYIHVLDGVGHMSMWEASSELNQHLLAFITR